MILRPWCLIFSLLAMLGCSAARPAAAPQPDLPLAANGQLRLVRVTTALEGTERVLSVTVANPYAEPVVGVRLIYRVLTTRDPESPEIARNQDEIAATLAPGQEGSFELRLPPEAGQAGFGSFLQVFAAKLGEADMTPPPFWTPAPH